MGVEAKPGRGGVMKAREDVEDERESDRERWKRRRVGESMRYLRHRSD
jgi:hypothetical protein